jgi:hypothetical protein
VRTLHGCRDIELVDQSNVAGNSQTSSVLVDGAARGLRGFQQQVELRQFVGSQGKTFQHGDGRGRKMLRAVAGELRHKERN